MRLLGARCDVVYTGRLTARLPEAVRLLMFKADGSFLVHDDAGGYRPLNSSRTLFHPRASMRSRRASSSELKTDAAMAGVPLLRG